jgi:hypothetical protein
MKKKILNPDAKTPENFENLDIVVYGERPMEGVEAMRVANFLDPEIMGPPMKPTQEEMKPVTTVEAMREAARHYGSTLHPLTNRPRVITVLSKLEEMGLRGNIQAAKEFLDRTMGKPTETTVSLEAKYQNASDAELLEELKKVTIKNEPIKSNNQSSANRTSKA